MICLNWRMCLVCFKKGKIWQMHNRTVVFSHTWRLKIANLQYTVCQTLFSPSEFWAISMLKSYTVCTQSIFLFQVTATRTKPYCNQNNFNQIDSRNISKFCDEKADLKSCYNNGANIWAVVRVFLPFVCFPNSGTKLLCVTESIIFIIEYSTPTKTDFLFHSRLHLSYS